MQTDSVDQSHPPHAQRILIIKPSSLGDIVHALPVLAALRDAYPDAHIAWMVGTSFASLLEDHPLLDEVITFDRKRYGRMWFSPAANFAFWRFVAEIRRRRFDWIVDLQGLIRSGLLSWFSGARHRVGFANAREGAWLFYTQRVRADRTAHAVDRNVTLARAIGLCIGTPMFPLAVRESDSAAARELLETAARARHGENPPPPPMKRGREADATTEEGPSGGAGRSDPPDDLDYVAILPGTRWASKNWPVEKFAALIDRIHAQADGARCVLLGAPSDRTTADEIRAHCRTAVIDLVGRTNLRQLVALLAESRAVISCDSGPLHLAAALNRPTVAIFGPTDPRRTGPYSPAAKVVTHGVNCAPCFRRHCPLKHQDCLRKLDPATVWDAFSALPPPAKSRATAPGAQ